MTPAYVGQFMRKLRVVLIVFARPDTQPGKRLDSSGKIRKKKTTCRDKDKNAFQKDFLEL